MAPAFSRMMALDAGDGTSGRFDSWVRAQICGREGLCQAIVVTYQAVFPQSHVCHGGPDYGVVVQELHAHSPIHGSQRPHNSLWRNRVAD